MAFTTFRFRFIYFHSIKPKEVNHRKLHVNEIYKDVNKVNVILQRDPLRSKACKQWSL